MKNRAFMKQSNAGFSLLEILAVMVILGILAALAAPGWLTFLSRQRATDAKNQVQQAIRTTQTEAKRLRRRRSIQFYPSATSAEGVPQVELNDSGIRETLGLGELDSGIIELTAVDDNGSPVPELIFRADGSLSVEDDDYGGAPPELPIMISIESPAGSNTKRCIMIETLLGAIDSGKDADCN